MTHKLVDLAGTSDRDWLLDRKLMTVVAKRLGTALASHSQGPAQQLRQDISDLIDKCWASLSREIRSELRDRTSSTTKAFLIGQISFAGEFLSQALASNESDEFVTAISNGTYDAYLSAMVDGEKSGVQLTEIVKHSSAHQSRQLAEMRKLGLCDFRREGRMVINFLTPAGRQAYEQRDRLREQRARDTISEEPIQQDNFIKQQLLNQEKEKMAPYMQTSLAVAARLEEAHA